MRERESERERERITERLIAYFAQLAHRKMRRKKDKCEPKNN